MGNINNTMKSCIDNLEKYLEEMPEGAALSRYLGWLNESFENKDPLYISDYGPIVEDEARQCGGDRPFLSVITRTQGKRDEMLRETLLCLAGQEDQDFEVVLVGHKADEDGEALIMEIIEEQPGYMREKIRYFPLEHGNRTTPLNFGFAHAHGKYIAIYDDDDIVMDNWVSAFKKAAEKREGAVLYAPVYYQEWMTVNTENGAKGLRACGNPIYNLFSHEFNLFEQLRCNNCPALGIAFPSYLFQKLGIIFDETLTTTEDWDYLMRCVLIVGVENVLTATSIYRYWENAGSSKTEHEKAEWDKNHLRILDKFTKMPMLVPQDAQKSLSRETMKAIQKWDWPYRTPKVDYSTLYIDRGNGFSQNDIIIEKCVSNGKYIDVIFNFPSESNDEVPVTGIRIDPGEEGMFVLKNVIVMFCYEDGSKEVRDLTGTITNGMTGKSSIFFLKNDPWIIWNDISKPLKFIRFVGEMSIDITDAMINDYMRRSFHPWRGVRSAIGGKAKSALNRFKGKH